MGAVPEISRFFGIVIRMFVESGEPHHAAHFHVYCQDDAAVFTIDPIELAAGALPLRQRRLVEAWAEMHQQELREAWQRLQAGKLPQRILPLR